MQFNRSQQFCAVLVALIWVGCGSSNKDASAPGTGGTPGAGASSGSGGDGGQAVPVVPPVGSVPPGAIPAAVVDTPDGLPPAPALTGEVHYRPNRSSVTVYVPEVEGAGDYRVFALADGVTLQADGEGEHVQGATIFCGGLRQHNHCDDSLAATDYGQGVFYVPPCREDVRAISVGRTVLRNVEVDGLVGKTRLVVEAIDELCPFTGAFGNQHADIDCVHDGQRMHQATYQGQVVSWEGCPRTFPIRTEQEIREEYGSLIINGHRPAPTPAAGESPYANLALPAEPRAPKVLGRVVIEVEPIGTESLPDGFDEAAFFEDFSDPADQPQLVVEGENGGLVADDVAVVNPKLYQTSQLSLYTYGADGAQMFVTQGALRSVLPDAGQQIMGSSLMYPRRAFQLPEASDRYLHVTFETQTDATDRRYFMFHACGAPQAGQTVIDGRLAPKAGILPSPSFMNPLEGSHISTQGWNCIQLVPRGGGYDLLDGGFFENERLGGSRPGTDIRVIINPHVEGYRHSRDPGNTVLNMSPIQYPGGGDAELYGGWFRQWNERKRISGVLLDDEMYIEQRTRIDVYFNRERMVFFANDIQKFCNDYPSQRLTMAEAAIGIGHVLYHSTAERLGFKREDWIRTAQHYYWHNTPFLDHRTFDNFGVREGVELPEGFAEGQCYRRSE